MPRSHRLLALAALCAVLAGASFAPSSARAAGVMDLLCARLQEVASGQDVVTAGVVVVDLREGARCAINGDRVFRTASLYKTLVAAELFRQERAGDISFFEPLLVQERHTLDDPEDLRPAEDFTVTAYEAAERMLIFSENSSANALAERLVGLDAFTTPAWLGLESTDLIDQGPISTANDQADLYLALYEGRVVDAEASREIIGMLARQEVADLIPAALPPGTRIAHKTGTLELWLHDAGIVYAPGGDFVFVVMTEGNDYLAAEALIHDLTRAAWNVYGNAAPPLLSPTDEMATTGFTRPLPATQPAQAITVARTIEGASPAMIELRSTPSIDRTSSRSGLPVLALDAARAASERWSHPGILAGLIALAAIALGLPAMMLRPALRKETRFSYGTNVVPQHDDRLRADRSERGQVMRFGSRRDDEDRDDRTIPTVPASRSVAQVAPQPVQPSVRLQRVAEHFRAQGELLTSMRAQFEEEMEPLHDLIVQQSRAMQALLQNLEERLRPLNEYADGEEANLVALEERIQSGGQDHVARSFSSYLDEQRRRISETREQIDRQRLPFLEYGDAQRDAIESALSRFDSDIEALEANQAEQRRVMVRMLDAMRSETFAAVKEYLGSRYATLTELAEDGATDPLEISRTAHALRRELEPLAAKSDYVRGLLEQTDASDQALADVVPAPRALRQEPAHEEPDEAETQESEFSA